MDLGLKKRSSKFNLRRGKTRSQAKQVQFLKLRSNGKESGFSCDRVLPRRRLNFELVLQSQIHSRLTLEEITMSKQQDADLILSFTT